MITTFTEYIEAVNKLNENCEEALKVDDDLTFNINIEELYELKEKFPEFERQRIKQEDNN